MARQALKTGSLIDGFLVGEKLHTGGMATLWCVTREDIDVPIVMKVPMILDGDDATVIVSFEMEMMLLPRLSGPHVPKLFGVGDYAHQPYLVMEYVQGKSLMPRFEAAPIPLDEVAGIGAKVARALVDLHRQNVIHLDIKPSNIMMRETGEVVLIDYGISRHLQLPDLLEEEFHVPMGTGPYISPEQVLRNRSEPRSDLFALGVLMYHLATGKRPFGAPRNDRGLRKRLWRDPVPPRAHNKDIPPWLQEVILRCLEVDCEDRYPSAAQLAFDLTHPNEVVLTERAQRMQRDGYFTALKRRLKSSTMSAVPRQPDPGSAAAAPIILAAVDLSAGMEQLGELLRVTIGRALQTIPGVRIALVNVLKQNRIGINYSLDDAGRNIHVQRLVELKDWAQPLGLDKDRITFHVLEHVDPAQALIEYARANHVDQIIIGARASSQLRRFLGSVSSQVVAEAPCTVTVVRVPTNPGDATGAALDAAEA